MATCSDVVAGTARCYFLGFDVVGGAIIDGEGVLFEKDRAAFGANLSVGGEQVDGEIVLLQAYSGSAIGFGDFDVVVGDVCIDHIA